jgi:hypothetical protein
MRKFTFALGCVTLMLMGTVALAGSVSGTIQVIVYDKDGGPIKGARVEAETPDSLTKRQGTTNENGEAFLVALDPANNYTVTTIFSGYNGARNDNVLVRSGETTSLRVNLTLSSVTETVTVTAETPLVDVTSAISSQEITLELTESLPTGRSYQSYLQLVPGVLPDDPDNPGNPASRSGLNYRDIGGDLGESRDNFYFLEGINVTDNVQGLFGANLNTEIIQEQQVITGAIPAEYPGAAGLISSVVTKFGGNDFGGSFNYFLQSDSLVADFDRQGVTTPQSNESFSTYDTALTFGGPIVKDKAWFFASYRNFNREDDVTAEDTGQFLRTVEDDQDQWYGKATYQMTNNDRLSATFLSDPTTISGLRDRDVLNTRDESRETGGDRFIATYQRVFGNGVIDVAVGKHNGELSRFSSINESANDVIFEANQVRTLADEQLGGFGENIIDERDTEFWKASSEWFVNSGWGQHTIKAGVVFEEHINFRDRNLINNAEFVSVDPGLDAFCNSNGCSGFGTEVTAQFLSTGSLSDTNWDVNNTSDLGGLLTTLNALPGAAMDYAFLDVDNSGDFTTADISAFQDLVFNSTAGNPNDQINYNRDLQTASGPQNTTSEGFSLYVQDSVQAGRWTVNFGVRAERWEHFATTGENIYKFDWDIAPRLSAVYDIGGNGKQKVSAFYGRYYDPIRNNMTNFAGTLTGRITEEQVWVDNGSCAPDCWLSFRTRGGPVTQDAFFSPTTKTPYTDEIEFSYQRDLGRNMSLEVNAIKRTTKDIMEDYDLSLYAYATDGVSTDYPGPIDDPDSLWLGLDYFGYAQNPGSNFVIGTLAGGKRDWEGLEVVFRKRYADNWQGLFSYNFASAEGNSNSDSNADFQGDVLYLDPRAPGQYGDQPGSIEHLLKAGGSYSWSNGFKVGGTLAWNSGTVASATELRFRRNLPNRLPSPTFDSTTGDLLDTGGNFEFAGINAGAATPTDTNMDGIIDDTEYVIDERWIQPGSVGSRENPDWMQVDVRAQYNRQFGRVGTEFFVDIFNLLDSQDATRTQDLVAGTGATAFGDPIRWVGPRRFFIGARLSF